MKTQDMQVKPKVEMPAALEKEAHAFSDVFLSAMEDYAYDTLRSQLEANGAQEAIELLDNIQILNGIRLMYAKETQVLYLWNNEASFCIGRISHLVPLMGKRFISPSGEILTA